MNQFKVGVNKVWQNFNTESVWRPHFVQEHEKLLIPFCGTTAELMIVDDAQSWIEDLMLGNQINLGDDGNLLCRRCVAAVMAAGSTEEEAAKRIERYLERKQRRSKGRLGL